MTPQPSTEARAKRTHARRSCDVCKVRKTRCELPDLEIPAGPNPLPLDKSCHRCKVLALPCIVDDSGKKQRKRPREDGTTLKASVSRTSVLELSPGEASQSTGTSPKRRASKVKRNSSAEASSASTSRNAPVDHTLNVIHGLSPMDSLPVTDPLIETLQQIRSEPQAFDPCFESTKSKSMKLHGRPGELTCAMLRVAYIRSDGKKKRGMLDFEEVDLKKMLDDQMKARLQPGFAQLQTYHPHLEPFATMLETHNATPEPSMSLLIALTFYLSTLALPVDTTIQNIRKVLTPYINRLRNDLLLHVPHSFTALSALELLATHCPFGVLPLQITNLQALGVARGHIFTSSIVSAELSFSRMVDKVTAGPGMRFAFKCTDIWLWLGMIAAEAAATLEDNAPNKPKHLADARRLADAFCDMTVNGTFWRDSLGIEDTAVLVGRLAVSDKLARLEDLLDGLARIKDTLENSASDPTYDPVRGIVAEFEIYTRKMEGLDTRHDSIMGLLRGRSRGVESGWLAYRAIRHRYELSKLHVTGLRQLMATHYLPGSPYAYPGLPPFPFTPSQAASYALSRAYNPPDIIRFITDTSRTGDSAAAIITVWDWGRRRGINLEETLAACAELGRNLVADLTANVYASIVPLHDVICIAVEAAKVLMEMEAGTVQILRSSGTLHKAFRDRSWLKAMSQMTETMRAIGMLVPEDDLGGESVANGCSNLIGSMVRTAEDWSKTLEKEQMALDAGLSSSEMPEPIPSRQPYANGNGHAFDPHRPAGVTSHQQYMDTSDRWMASNETTQMNGQSGLNSQPSLPPPPASSMQVTHPPRAQFPQQPQQHFVAGPIGTYPPTSLDQLLSEMFCYSYQPHGLPPAHSGTASQSQHIPPPPQVGPHPGVPAPWA